MTEIEIRAILTKVQYINLLELANKFTFVKSEDLIVTYYWPYIDDIKRGNQTIKIANNQNTKKSRIVSKIKNASSSDLEYEFFTDERTAQNIDKLLYISKWGRRYQNIQKRNDYEYLFENINYGISLKYSTDWGYHMEIDVMIEGIERMEFYKKQIYKIYDSFSIKPLSEAEENILNKRILDNRKEDPII